MGKKRTTTQDSCPPVRGTPVPLCVLCALRTRAYSVRDRADAQSRSILMRPCGHAAVSFYREIKKSIYPKFIPFYIFVITL